jgi:hypothetical protein
MVPVAPMITILIAVSSLLSAPIIRGWESFGHDRDYPPGQSRLKLLCAQQDGDMRPNAGDRSPLGIGRASLIQYLRWTGR